MPEPEYEVRHEALPSEEIRRRLAEKAELVNALRATRPTERRISGEGSALEREPAPRPLRVVEPSAEDVTCWEPVSLADVDPMELAQRADAAKSAEADYLRKQAEADDARVAFEEARRAFFSYLPR